MPALLLMVSIMVPVVKADDFNTVLKPLLDRYCVRCHGATGKVRGDVNLSAISASHLTNTPELAEAVRDALEAGTMPPESEVQPSEQDRDTSIRALNAILKATVGTQPVVPRPVRRLNRFQYNNAVRDLLQLKRNIFALPEKLMTRRSEYLGNGVKQMPDKVHAVSQTLKPEPGLSDVKAFPKDLRASHGFDNQANQLTLSPLLLDAFLRLSVSIVESPDFNEENVGIWEDFFAAPPAGEDPAEELRRRLKPFLRTAFRRPVEPETLKRYAAYGRNKLEQGTPFTKCMKQLASAVLSSPKFLYRWDATDESNHEFELASDLSFFLWSSGPDSELLDLAERGQLSEPQTLKRTVTRMLTDRRIERFLDNFPAQWMQLENVLAATPDPRINPYYSLDNEHPASLQMLLEPLLLFDTVFVEDRSVMDLVSPGFGYQSQFLRTWYDSELRPPVVDVKSILNENARHQAKRRQLEASISNVETRLSELLDPVREKILSERIKNVDSQKPVDLKPYAAWEFNEDLRDSIGSLHLNAHGDVVHHDGTVTLNKSYLLSEPLPLELKAKSLEVWCRVHDLNQRGGGVMGIQGPGDFFDTIVLGERKPRHWISGSNGFSRTEDFPESFEENRLADPIHLVMVYEEDGTTTLYRNGTAYGKPYQKGTAVFPGKKTSVIFGLRHLPPGGNRYLHVSLDQARLYTRALTADEVASAASGQHLFVSEDDLAAAMAREQAQQWKALKAEAARLNDELTKVPADRDPKTVQENVRREYEDAIRAQLRDSQFIRTEVSNPRYGGVITNAAMLTMTSGPKRTHPIARGAWVIEVIFNDPPPPPPNDVPPLNDQQTDNHLTIREKFAKHRENPDCAGCHSRLDPLGFALENYDITGRWRDRYKNGRDVDASGTLLRRYNFGGIQEFKAAIMQEDRRFARAFTAHLMRYALARELNVADSLTIDDIVDRTEQNDFRIQSLIREVILSRSFQRSSGPHSHSQPAVK